MRLAGKTIVITGAGGNIGTAYCDALVAEGARLVMADLSDLSAQAKAYQQQGHDVVAVQADISKQADNQKIHDVAMSHFQRIDGLINNAGFFKNCTFGSFLDIPEQEWDTCYQVNVKGLWMTCKAIAPQMIAQGQGKIINVSSNTPYKGIPNFLHYVSSKAAVIGLSRAMARELGEYNITVNSLCPDLIPDADIIAKQGTQADERTVASRCLKRTQTPEDMAGAAVFLLSDDSNFITGQSLLVNGGAHFL